MLYHTAKLWHSENKTKHRAVLSFDLDFSKDLKFFIYLFGCTKSLLQHAGSFTETCGI